MLYHFSTFAAVRTAFASLVDNETAAERSETRYGFTLVVLYLGLMHDHATGGRRKGSEVKELTMFEGSRRSSAVAEADYCNLVVWAIVRTIESLETLGDRLRWSVGRNERGLSSDDELLWSINNRGSLWWLRSVGLLRIVGP